MCTSTEYPITALNAEVHIINSVYVLIDLWVVASPLRILHFYIPFIYLTIYLIFTLIYYYAGGLTPDGKSAIYPIMDWENLQVTIPFVVCCAVFMPAMQVRWQGGWGPGRMRGDEEVRGSGWLRRRVREATRTGGERSS